jgi:hypothetical protein
MASTTPRSWQSFEFSSKNIRVQLPVEHISLSPSPWTENWTTVNGMLCQDLLMGGDDQINI